MNAVFSQLRYAQVWEDADVLLDALDVRPGDVCLSVGSAGDNALALLARGAARVVALDLNPAQIACLELRVAAFRRLEHPELLALVGSDDAPADARAALYRRCRPELSDAARAFWDARPAEIACGVGGVGKFERYFALFRRWLLPLVHGRRTVARLLDGGPDRARFYECEWDTWRWRLLFRVFFSRTVMGRLGRDPSFFRYVEESRVADRILERTRHALTVLDPAENPYLRWILTGRHAPGARPFALREENFGAIRAGLNAGRMEWRCENLENFLDGCPARTFDGFNLSDLFEYLPEDTVAALLAKLGRAGRPGARLAYWNMLAPRSRPESLAGTLRPLGDLARTLHARDQAFFYSRLVIEEVLA